MVSVLDRGAFWPAEVGRRSLEVPLMESYEKLYSIKD